MDKRNKKVEEFDQGFVNNNRIEHLVAIKNKINELARYCKDNRDVINELCDWVNEYRKKMEKTSSILEEDKKSENKNIENLNDFISYCKKHPELRFWQALRNWSGYSYVLVAQEKNSKDEYIGLKDTFYMIGG